VRVGGVPMGDGKEVEGESRTMGGSLSLGIGGL